MTATPGPLFASPPLPRHDFKCHVCRRPWAPFGVTGPGPIARHPAGLRGKRLRFCELGGECEAQAVARTIRAFGMGWTFQDDELRARVETILGERVADPWDALRAAMREGEP